MATLRATTAILAAALFCTWAHAGLIDIGSQKQLFWDEHMLENRDGVTPVLNPARKVEHNPIITRDRPWEGNYLALKCVLYFPEEELFRMWYTTSSFVSKEVDGIITIDYDNSWSRLCVATSKDGIHWEKPVLGQTEYEGSTDNNIVSPDNIISQLYFFRDEHEKDPKKRFKGYLRTKSGISVDKLGSREIPKAEKDAEYYYQMANEHWNDTMEGGTAPVMKFDLYTSPDLENWTAYEGNPVIANPPEVRVWGPTRFMGWDPIREKYAVHMEPSWHRRADPMIRLVGRAESSDGIHWTHPETIIMPDEKDPADTQFYLFSVIPYEGMYAGVTSAYTPNRGYMRTQFLFSRDGIRYDRRYREPLIQLGSTGDFDSLELYCQPPLVHDGKIFLYYLGRNSGHDRGLFYEQVSGEDVQFSAIGLAILPEDGFVSLDAGEKGGEFITLPFSFTGNRLHFNVGEVGSYRLPGEIKVELLGPAHHKIPGRLMEDCDPITTGPGTHVVSWNGDPDLSDLEGKTIKLRVWMRNCKLYSYQFKDADE